MIQWGIEFDDEDDEPRYIESNDALYIGHVSLKKAILSRNNFYVQVMEEKETKEIEIIFPDQDKNDFLSRIVDLNPQCADRDKPLLFEECLDNPMFVGRNVPRPDLSG